ncbi:hypothetical protein LCGC14_0267900 [marine sediment metagenome]|uniref:Uncharacterized protein n=1 Tax=marine sediment metagenome TaxID=412755 RepID=A0A0F9U4R2_9ZZZZ
MKKLQILGVTVYVALILLLTIPIVEATYPTEDNTKERVHDKWLECLEYNSIKIENDCIENLFKATRIGLDIPKTEEEFDYFFVEYLHNIRNGYHFGVSVIFMCALGFGGFGVYLLLDKLPKLRFYVEKDNKDNRY